MAARTPRHMINGDGAFVVGQQIRRHPTQTAQGGVQASDQTAQRPVPSRDHHPETAPRQPGTEQTGAPTTHAGTLAPVPLAPHARLGHPRPITAAVPIPPRLLALGHRPTAGALLAPQAPPPHPAASPIRPAPPVPPLLPP